MYSLTTGYQVSNQSAIYNLIVSRYCRISRITQGLFHIYCDGAWRKQNQAEGTQMPVGANLMGAQMDSHPPQGPDRPPPMTPTLVYLSTLI
jgi:hypothetical protein